MMIVLREIAKRLLGTSVDNTANKRELRDTNIIKGYGCLKLWMQLIKTLNQHPWSNKTMTRLKENLLACSRNGYLQLITDKSVTTFTQDLYILYNKSVNREVSILHSRFLDIAQQSIN